MSIIDVFTELKNNLLANRKDLVLNPGSAIVDIFLTPTAFIINKNRILLEYRTRLQTLTGIEDLLTDEEFILQVAEVENKTESQVKDDISGFIDQFGGNYGLTRRTSIVATGYAYFGRFDPPTFDITIPAGTQIKTLDEKYYQTTDTVVMTVLGSWYDPSLNLHVIKAPISALSDGIAGNTASSTINVLISQIPGIQFVTNKEAITNGRNEETDSEFIARIRERLMGTNWATKSGIRNLILDNFPSIKDVYVADANDPIMTRNDGLGGKADVYLLDETLSATAADVPIQFNALGPNGEKGVLLLSQPIDDSDLSAWYVNGVNISLTDWIIVKDTTSVLAQSNFARSYIYSPTATTVPASIAYKKFQIVNDVYNFFLSGEYFMVGSITGAINPVDVTILFKKANVRKLNIQFILYVVAGYDINAVKSLVTTAINDYVNALLLGDKIAQSDITGLVEDIEGVDFIDFAGGVFDLDAFGLQSVLQPSVVEYIRLNTLVINP